jgi:autotransporter-associated beta strand protein
MKINIKILNIAAIMCVACAAYADTGVWTNVSGGYWADTNNWQSGYVPVGTTNVADFAGLNSSETVMLTNYTEIGAVLFAGTEGDVWTLATDTNAVMGFAQVDQAGEIQVEGGRLNVMIPIKNADYGILKKGSGALYIAGTNDYTGITSLDGGTLILTNGTALRKSSVVFNSTNAVLKLQGDALIGGLTSAVEPTPDVALNGYELQIGGSQDQLEWSGRFTGTGTLAVVRGEVQTLTSEQSWKGVARVDNGILQLGRQQGQIVGWWRFDDAQDIGKDSGSLDNNLSRNGSPTQWQVQDAERGAVLTLDSLPQGSGCRT